MSRLPLEFGALIAGACAGLLAGCPQEQGTAGAPTASASVTAPAVASPPTPASAPAPSATVAHKPIHPCPDGSSGEGSLAKPCEGKGVARLMEVTWTGKMTDTGPSFRVTNKSKIDILYGNVSAYFYDKAGKQLEVKDASGKPRPRQACAGKIFDGVMKAGEKATITFSCVKKDNVPEGTVHVEAEMQTVGFVDESGKGMDSYWRNNDLVPDARPKGGIKK